MFSKILIANRGEIACRVAATARKMAIKTVAVYSHADRNAKHVQACDEAVYIGTGEGNTPQDSYLRWQAILAAAKSCAAQAVHPGYGFLSENEEFAKACAEHGLVFIGPPPAAIKAMGLKAQAKQLMAQAGVPLVPGYHGANQDLLFLQEQAERISYPVLIKASAGGGGKGMRIVERAQDFAAALTSCKREALNSFGDDAVLLEKYVHQPRHIEIQIFGDAHGNCLHLFERDCSVQRRHQKVLEEAPAPGMTERMRQAMGQAAVEAARAVGYIGAGTVEFIVEQSGGYNKPDQMKFYFMEMNTRLQVEHPVTETITGIDLVQWQLLVACGEPLPLRQDQLRINGHAIEARICAENPDHGFLPSIGSLQVYRKPAHHAFACAAQRFDDGVRQGDSISPYYDSMIAKLIVHGSTRQEALARLDLALAQTHIVGLSTNVQFLRHVLASKSFSQAQLDTALIERERSSLFSQEKLALPRVIAAQIAHTLTHEWQLQTSDPFGHRDGFRAFGHATRKFSFVWHDAPVQAQLDYLHDGSLYLRLACGDQQHEGVLTCTRIDADLKIGFADQQYWAAVYHTAHERGHLAHIHMAQGATKLLVIDPFIQLVQSGAQGGRLTAPMPGKLVSIAVSVGDTVSAGETLAVMDAMKMEHSICAPEDGVVAEILFAPGDQVGDGAELIRLQTTQGASP